MKKMIYAILLALALSLVPASWAAETAAKVSTTPTVEKGSSSKDVAQTEGKHKKKHHHHKKDKKGKEVEQPKA